jgi:hypothetical protein
MSDNESNSNSLQEVTRKVVITPEDVAGARDFWTHFEVPIPVELTNAFDNFCKNPTLENQDEIKLQITRAIGHTKHEAFQDEMFKEIVAECQNVEYDMAFDRQLESTLTTPDLEAEDAAQARDQAKSAQERESE